MTTREDLDFIRNYRGIEHELKLQLKRLREKVDVSSVQFDSVLGHSSEYRDRMADHAAAVDLMERKYEKLICDYHERYLRLLNDIAFLQDADENKIIRMRYQEGCSWGYIQRETHYERSNVFRIHNRALNHLASQAEKL